MSCLQYFEMDLYHLDPYACQLTLYNSSSKLYSKSKLSLVGCNMIRHWLVVESGFAVCKNLMIS